MVAIVGLFSPAGAAIVDHFPCWGGHCVSIHLPGQPLLVCFPLLGMLADSSFLLSPTNDSVGQSDKG